MNKVKFKNFISAVVYVRNAESNLENFLNSLYCFFSNNFVQSEIICVNDDSSDESKNIIKKFTNKNCNISLSVVNMSYFQGVEASMNAGVDFAIGDYVSLNTCFLMGGNYDFVKKEEGKTPTTYFRLEDIYGNYKIGSGGWMQVYAEDEEYKHLRTITETSFGNNPHNGNMRYDCGYDYVDHFDKLFKLHYEDSLIDTRCYKSYYEEIMDNDGNSLLPLIGFKGIKCSDDDCVICYKEYEDTKVHDFCDIIEDSGNTASYYDKPKYGDDNTRHLSGMSPNDDELTYEEIYEQISSYTSNVVETYDYNPITSGLPINDNTNQIVNLKRVDLIFNMEKDHVGEHQSKNYLEAYHYIDNVIMKYVEQVIPSNVIMKVVYKSNNG